MRLLGEEAAAKLGLDAVGFVAKRENWFPRASVEAAAAAVRAALKPRAVAYGYSMGGYGALKHARAAGRRQRHRGRAAGQHRAGRRALGRALPSLPPPRRCTAACGSTAADLAPFTAVLADPYDATDWHHARLAAEAGAVHLLRTPHVRPCGDLAAGRHRDAGGRCSTAALAEDAGAMRALLRGRRANSGHWFRLMARAAFGRGHARLAEALWTRAGELGVAPRGRCGTNVPMRSPTVRCG